MVYLQEEEEEVVVPHAATQRTKGISLVTHTSRTTVAVSQCIVTV